MQQTAYRRSKMVQEKTNSWGLQRISHPYPTPLEDSFFYPASAGEGVIVYVLDTGINTNHIDFGGRATLGDFLCEFCDDIIDHDGHGTAVASIIGGSYAGVAKKAEIVSVKITAHENESENDYIYDAFIWVEKHFSELKRRKKHMRALINFSFGGLWDDEMDYIAQKFAEKGFIIITAAGNDAQEYVLLPFFFSLCKYSFVF